MIHNQIWLFRTYGEVVWSDCASFLFIFVGRTLSKGEKFLSMTNRTPVRKIKMIRNISMEVVPCESGGCEDLVGVVHNRQRQKQYRRRRSLVTCGQIGQHHVALYLSHILTRVFKKLSILY